ncbi:MAG: hypothetical protein JW839_07540 [Candidatus Lokiarchaeota archaeon]|nr:hypothetical protein [Candidatus Lokiarchaeota archaeon]
MTDEAKPVSFEGHARRHHRYHPAILKATIALFKQHAAAVSELFSSEADSMLFLNAIKNAKVVVLNTRKIASGRRAPAKRRNPCLEHFCWYPGHIRRFFRSRADFLGFVRFVHTAAAATRSGARRSDATAPLSQRQTGSTPCFMLANHPIWASGVLNKPGRHVGNTFDMATFEGFVFFMHEAFHVMQWYRSPLRLLFEYMRAVVKSLALSDGHIPWAHELIEFEVEAMVFHNKLWMLLDSWPGALDYLSRFGAYR